MELLEHIIPRQVCNNGTSVHGKVLRSKTLKDSFRSRSETLEASKVDYEYSENFAKRLDDCNTLADVFELVKRSVKRFLSKQRGGLMLGLVDLETRRGYFVGAFHPVGSNIIIMNRAPLKMASKSRDKRAYNAYCFHMLLHEYLHALGYLDEDEVHDLVHEVCSLALGKDHPATVMAERGIAFYFPRVTHFSQEPPLPRNLNIELVKDFDKSSAGYIL